MSAPSGSDAFDTVTEILGIPEGKLVKALRFTRGNEPTLLQLAIAAATVHDDSPQYRAFGRQCYWFADVLLQVLARRYQSVDSNDSNANEDDCDQVRVPQGEDEEKFVQKIEKGELFAPASCNNGGKFMILRIYWAKKKVIEKVEEDFKTRRRGNEAKVCMSNNFL